MTTYGVTPQGFLRKPQEVILSELEADVLAIDPTLNLAPTQPLGQLLGIMSTRLSEQWELTEAAFNSNDRGQAEFFLLDNIGALTGCPRKFATFSQVSLNCTLTTGTVLRAGIARANVAGKPSDTWTPVADSTAPSNGVFPVLFRATTLGALRAANTSTITAITAPISGWSAVTNPAAAAIGQDEELDADYRTRQVAELAQGGSSTAPAVRAGLLQVTGVIEAKVFENSSNVTDVNGLPPHAMHCVIWDGASPAAANTDVAQAIWENKGGGIGFTGAISAVAEDSDNNPETILFDRATQRLVYVSVTVKQDPTKPAVDPAAVAAAIAPLAPAIHMGNSVIRLGLEAAVMGVPGVLDITAFTLDFTASPTATANLSVGTFDIALLNVSRVTVTVTS